MNSATGVHADSLDAIAPGVRAEVESQFECTSARPLAEGAWAIDARATSLGGRAVTIHLFDREVLRRHEAERALDEGCAAWRALVHPNAVTPLRLGTGAEARWVVSPATHGTDLAEQLRRAGAVPLEEALRIIEQLASVLHEAHQRGAAHGAVRPDQVQLDDRGWATLLGCGVAHVVDRMAGRVPPSLAPAEDQADLARLLLCCLVGIPAWTDDDRVSLELVPAPTLTVIRQALSPRAAARYADVLEFVSALRSSQWSAAPATPLIRPQPLLLVGPPLGATGHRALAIAGVACIVTLLATAIVPSDTKVTSLAVAPDRAAPVTTIPPPFPEPSSLPPAVVPARIESVPTPPVKQSVSAAASKPASPPASRAESRPTKRSAERSAQRPVQRPAPRSERSGDRLVARSPAPGRVAANAPAAAAATQTTVALASAPSGGGTTPPAVPLPPTIDVESPRARLSVSARPWGDIYIDGRAMGSTPKAQLPLDPGPRRIRIVRPGFGIFDTLVVVRAGDHVRLIDVLLPTASP